MPGGASLTGPTVILRSDALTLTLSHREREQTSKTLLHRRCNHAARHRLLNLLLIHIHRA